MEKGKKLLQSAISVFLIFTAMVTVVCTGTAFAQQQAGQAFQVTPTAFKFDPDGRDIPLGHSDGTPILPSEVEAIFGNSDGFSITVGGLLVTSSLYGGASGFEAPKQVVFQDLSDAAGWPDVHVIHNTVAVDPGLGRLKFADGDSDPPQLMGSVHLHWGSPFRGTKHGDFYYICQGESDKSLVVVDVSDPSSPQLASMVEAGWSINIAIYDQYAYVSDLFGRIYVFDKSNPYNLWLVSVIQLSNSGRAGRVLKKDNSIYIPQRENRMAVVDVADPANYQIITETQLPGQTGTWIPVLHENFAFVFEESASSTPIMKIFDISDLNNMTLLSATEVSSEPVFASFDEKTMAFNGSLLYLVTGGDGLKIFDLTDPANPILRGEYEKIPGPPPNWTLKDIHQGVAVSGNSVYLSGHLGVESNRFGTYAETNNGFVMEVDVTDPTTPTLINEFVKDENFTNFYDIEVDNNLAYIIDNNYGLRIVDLSDNTQSFPLLGGYRSAGEGSDVYVHGDYAYVAQNIGGGVSIIDISDKSNPQLVGYYHAGFDVWGIQGVKNETVYVTGPWVGNSYSGSFSIPPPIHLVDVSDPTNPQLVQKLEGYFSFHPEIHNGLLFTNDVMYDVSNPLNPVRFWDPYAPPAPFWGNPYAGLWRLASSPLSIRGNYLYRAPGGGTTKINEGGSTVDHGYAFSVLDITAPENPSIVGLLEGFSASHFKANLVVRNDYAFFPGSWGSGIQIVDISDPAQPTYLGEIPAATVGSTLETVLLDGNYLYVQNYSGGLSRVFEIQESATGPLPIEIVQQVGNDFGFGSSWSSRIYGDYLYNASIIWFNIFDIPRSSEAPATPVIVSYFPAGPGTISGTVTDNIGTVANAIVDVYDTNSNLIASENSAVDGSYEFIDIDPGNYTVEIITPLGYQQVSPRVVDATVQPQQETVVNFQLQRKTIIVDARGSGYWKHQVKALLNQKGHADETAESLQGYLQVIKIHWNHFDYLTDDPIEQALTSLEIIIDLPRHPDMEAKANRELMALLLNVAAEKIATFTEVSSDDDVGEAIAYIIWILEDANSTDTEFEAAKDLGEAINNGDLPLDPSLIPESIPKPDSETIPDKQVPSEYLLLQNYPNPFNPTTTIRYDLPEAAYVTLKIYNLLGQEVQTVLNERQTAGERSVVWDGYDQLGREVSSGIYIYKIQAGDFVKTRKMLLIR